MDLTKLDHFEGSETIMYGFQSADDFCSISMNFIATSQQRQISGEAMRPSGGGHPGERRCGE
jgi:hypothetical protein